MASGTALVREVSLAVSRRPDTPIGGALEEGRELTGPLIDEMARAGDPVALAALETIGRNLGVGIANVVNIFNPQVVVVGGGVIGAGDLVLEPAREVVRERALSPARDEVRIEQAGFGPEAGMLGAAIMAAEEIGLASPGLAEAA
jgi:glucokinase